MDANKTNQEFLNQNSQENTIKNTILPSNHEVPNNSEKSKKKKIIIIVSALLSFLLILGIIIGITVSIHNSGSNIIGNGDDVFNAKNLGVIDEDYNDDGYKNGILIENDLKYENLIYSIKAKNLKSIIKIDKNTDKEIAKTEEVNDFHENIIYMPKGPNPINVIRKNIEIGYGFQEIMSSYDSDVEFEENNVYFKNLKYYFSTKNFNINIFTVKNISFEYFYKSGKNIPNHDEEMEFINVEELSIFNTKPLSFNIKWTYNKSSGRDIELNWNYDESFHFDYI